MYIVRSDEKGDRKDTTRRLVAWIAESVDAWHRCKATNNTEWHARHHDTLSYLVRNFMPSGSGIDSGVNLVIEKSTDRRLVFETSFHHMHESGVYDGWTEHVVTVDATLTGFDIKVSGRDRNDIKDYLADIFRCSLNAPICQDAYPWRPGSDGPKFRYVAVHDGQVKEIRDAG